MQLLKHLTEPTQLLLVWQSGQKEHRTRYVVGELNRDESGQISLTYLTSSNDFQQAKAYGFQAYPAFPNVNEVYHQGVLEAFMRRLPPKSRLDYNLYLEGFRVPSDVALSDFSLLGYTGARLPSDGFSLINPFKNINTAFDFLTEATGFHYQEHIQSIDIEKQSAVSFKESIYNNEPAIEIISTDKHRIGFITRALIQPFNEWLKANRVKSAWIEKKNGTPQQPILYLYIEIEKLNS